MKTLQVQTSCKGLIKVFIYIFHQGRSTTIINLHIFQKIIWKPSRYVGRLNLEYATERRENLRSINYLWMKTSLIRVVFHNLDSTIRQPHLYLTKEGCGVFIINIAISHWRKAVYFHENQGGRGTGYPLMKWHIGSRLFTKWDDFFPFVFYMVDWSLGNEKMAFSADNPDRKIRFFNH